MPKIDPQRLLRCLTPLLDSAGSIKSDRDVDKIFGLMSKYSRKLVSKCIYLNILKVTTPETLDLFLSRGGWELLNGWFSDAIANNYSAVLDQMLDLFLIAPLNVERLKQNEIGKMVKTLSKDTAQRQSTQDLAKQLFSKMLNIARPSAITTQSTIIPPTTELNLEEDLTSLDLSDLQFNPEDFNTTLEALDDAQIDTVLASESDQQTNNDPSSIIMAQTNNDVIHANLEGDTLSEQYTLVSRDGKNFLVRVQDVHNQPIFIGSGDDPDSNSVPLGEANTKINEPVQDVGRKRSRKDPTIKKVSGGKPPLRTYSNLSGYDEGGAKKNTSATTTSNTSTTNATATTAGVTASQQLKQAKIKAAAATVSDSTSVKTPSKGKPPLTSVPKEKDLEKLHKTSEKDKPSSTKTSSTKKNPTTTSSSTNSSSKGPSASKKSLQQTLEEQRQLKIKVKEQKRIADERRKKAEMEATLKAQKQRDEETLKSLNLVALGTKPIPKIPKRPVNFADAIGIPGATGTSSKEKSDKKSTSPEKKELRKQSSIDEKTKLGTSPSTSASSTATTTTAPPNERKRVISHPKVKVTTKTRGSSLIEDMTRTAKPPASTTEGVKTRGGSTSASAALTTAGASASQTSEAITKPKTIEALKPSEPNPKSKAENKTSNSAKSSPSDSSSPSKIGRKKRPSSDLPASELNEAKKVKLTTDGVVKMEIDDDEPVILTPAPETPSTPPPRKVVGLQESSLFMDTLNANTTSSSKDSRRLRRRTSSTTEGNTETKNNSSNHSSSNSSSTNKTSSNKSPSTPDSTPKPVFNFYRETLTDENEDVDDPTADLNISMDDAPADDILASPTINTKVIIKKSSSPTELKSILHVHRTNSQKPKKSVSFVEDENLKSYFYFEMDETERVNVTRLGNADGVEEDGFNPASIIGSLGGTTKNFTEMKQLEKADEKKQLVKRRGLFGTIDTMEEKIKWSKPKKVLVEGLNDVVISSREIAVQEERERGSLQAFYFTKSDIPDCPEECDSLSESFEMAPPTMIPLEDIVGITKVLSIEEPSSQSNQAQQKQVGDGYEQQNSMYDNNIMDNSMGVGNAFDSATQFQQPNMWNTAAATNNPFLLAMAAAAAGGGGVDAWGNPLNLLAAQQQQMILAQQLAQAQQQQQQRPPDLMEAEIMNPYYNQYEDYNELPSHNFNQPRRRGGGADRRQFSRFDNERNNERNFHDRGSGGGRGRGDFNGRRGGGGDRDRRTNRMGNMNNAQHSFRGEGRIGNHGEDRGGRDFRGGGGGDDQPPKRERGRVGRTVLCKFFVQNMCKNGPQCDFLHPGINGPNRGGRFPNPDYQQIQQKFSRSGGDGGNNSNSNNSSENQQATAEVDASPASPDPISSQPNDSDAPIIVPIINNDDDVAIIES